MEIGKIDLTDMMANSIDLWEKMLEERAPWVNGDSVVSLGLEAAVCREFSNVVLSEMDTTLGNEELDPLYQRAVADLFEHFQDGLGLGCMVVKPIGNTGKFEYISANNIIPVSYSDDGTLRDVVFLQVKRINDTETYVRAERHALTKEGLKIQNRAFRGTESSFGTPVPLDVVDEWASLPEEVTYPIDRMDFGFYKNPLPNRIDRSKQGVSIFHTAIEKIKKADIQYGRLDWEYESGERAVMADWSFFDKSQGHFRMPKGKERMFIATEQDDAWHDHSPVLRDQSYINGLNEYKRQIEFDCALAYGDLSKNEQVEKTAQEIRAAKNRKYNMVNAIQKKLRVCLEDLAWAIAFYNLQYNSDLGFECSFHDSIKTDEETERTQDRLDVANGVMSKVEYRMKWYGEDEKTAAANIAKAMEVANAMSQEPID